MSAAEAAAAAILPVAPKSSSDAAAGASSPSTTSASTRSAVSVAAPTAALAAASTPAIRLTLDATTLICDKAVLQGTITIGAGSVIHPRARLRAVSPSSSVVIGVQCVVSEDAVVEAVGESACVTVGNWVVLESRAVVRGSVGHASWLRCGCEVTESGMVGRGCEVGVGVRVDGKVEDGSLLRLGDSGEQRRETGGIEQQHVREREKRHMDHAHTLLTADRQLLSKHHKMIR